MKKIKKLKISWAFGNPVYYQIDFGRFDAHEKNQIEVEEDFWNKYCDARFIFEIAQKQMADKISVRGRDKISETPKKNKR